LANHLQSRLNDQILGPELGFPLRTFICPLRTWRRNFKCWLTQN